METDDLTALISSLDRSDCYRVDAVLKDGALERTERVFFVGANGAELGPFVRKRIRRGLGVGYEAIYQAQREGLRLRFVPRLLECTRTGDELCVVMEFVEGDTLDECVERCEGQVARGQLVKDVFPKVCAAVEELHTALAQPIIHRDVKPQNVMVSNGNVTLVDLGIARIFKGTSDADTARFGTRSYAPPEQFGFGETSVRSDVFALGRLLAFCLLGHEVAGDVVVGELRDAGVSRELADVVEHATRLDPKDRYQSVDALLQDFRRAVKAPGLVSFSGARSVVPSFSDGLPDPLPSIEGQGLIGARHPMPSRRTVSERLAKAVGSVPSWAGIAWNVVVLLFFALFIYVDLDAAMEPPPVDNQAPQWYLTLSYVLFIPLAASMIAYLLLDRRRLRGRFPNVRWRSVAWETGMGILGLVGLVLVWLIIGMIASMA